MSPLFRRMIRRAVVTIVSAGLVVGLPPAAWAQRGRVNGIVRDGDGQPVKGVTVVAESLRAQPSSFTATTDEKGRFVLVGLQGGMWHFAAAAPGYASEQQDIDVSLLRRNTPIEIRLVKVILSDPTGMASVNTRDLQANLQAAEALLAGGQYDAAIAAYQAILARSPSLTTVNLRIADAYQQKKDYAGAIAACRQLLQAEPGNQRATVALARIYLEQGDVRSAEETLQAAAGNGPSAEMLVAFGDVKMAQDRVDEASQWFEKAAALEPAWQKPVYMLGMVALKRGDKDAAARQMARVVAAAPASPEAAEARRVLDQLKK
jgi:tetratricopeptide (TPR) repeat protein